MEQWIKDGNPLQLAPDAFPTKGRQPPTALQIALETGQHSLILLLMRSGYRPDLEPESKTKSSQFEQDLETRRIEPQSADLSFPPGIHLGTRV